MIRRATTLTVLSMLAAAAGADTATFRFIGPGVLGANDLSPDGRWVVGGIDTDGDLISDIAYRYDTLTDTLLQLPGPATSAAAVSDDGSVIIGDLAGPASDPLAEEAGIWYEETNTWVSMGFLPNAGACPSRSNAYELSADGTVAVGLSWDACNGRGFRWTQAEGMVELESLASGANRASVISADGSVIGGFAQGTFGRSPAKWDGLTTAGESLTDDWGAQGEVFGMSDDGSTLLGRVFMGISGWLNAVKWVDGGEPELIGQGGINPFLYAGNAMDIAGNGTIVGFDNRQGQRIAWIQPNGTGDVLNLETYLEGLGATLPPLDLGLEVCQAISTDGTTIIGHGLQGAWIVTIQSCEADLTGDGVLDLADINAFVSGFTSQDAISDFDSNGIFDLADINSFVAVFLVGCEGT